MTEQRHIPLFDDSMDDDEPFVILENSTKEHPSQIDLFATDPPKMIYFEQFYEQDKKDKEEFLERQKKREWAIKERKKREAMYDNLKTVSEKKEKEKEIKEVKRSIFNYDHLRECIVECLGTFTFIVFGLGGRAQMILTQGEVGDVLSANLAWGLGVMFALHVCRGVSGGHLNPSISFTLAIYHRLDRRKLFGYILSQFLGAFLAAAVVYLVYYRGIHDNGGFTLTNGLIFFTGPREFDDTVSCIISQFIATALLLGSIFACTDARNYPFDVMALKPLIIALLIIGIGLCFGPINPARDFGPRLFTWLVGWSSEVWTVSDYYFWTPLVIPYIGGYFGASVYHYLIQINHPPPLPP